MNSLKWCVLVILIPASSAFATDPFLPVGDDTFYLGKGPDVLAMPYWSFIEYGDGSVKSTGNLGGVYSTVDFGLDLFEIGIEYTDINFRSGFNLNQEDYTFVYNNFWKENFKFRGGFHYINSNDVLTDGGWIGFVGAHMYELNQWDAGVDAYVSRYEDFNPSVTITQITPHIGWYHTKTDDLTIRSDLRGYYISSNADLGLDKLDFFSIEGRIGVQAKKLSGAVFGWVGEQTFAVRQDGFVVFNLSEIHSSGYGGEIGYNVRDNINFTARISNENFTDFLNERATNQIIGTLILAMTF